MGRGFLRLMGEFAQIEREMISDRVTESMKYRAKKGKWNGGVVTFGYVTFEHLVKECFDRFPESFSFYRYKNWPDSLKLDRPIRKLRRNYGYIKGKKAKQVQSLPIN